METPPAPPTTLRLPWVTHIGVMLVLTLWWYAVTLDLYGVEDSGGWWDPGLSSFGLALVVGVVLLIGLPLGWLEAWAVQSGLRRGARLLAVTFVALAGLQLLLVWWMTRWPFPTTRRGAGRRWAKRVGLVE